MMGRKKSQPPSFIDTGDSFPTKPHEIANYLNDNFINKVDKLRHEMSTMNHVPSHVGRIKLKDNFSLKFELNIKVE